MKLLVTGSGGLIGSEVCEYFNQLKYEIIGIDNNSRENFFGIEGSVAWKIDYLKNKFNNYKHYYIDIRNSEAIDDIFKIEKPDAVVHCAAQPSHDKATDMILEDFEINTKGTLNLLNATFNTNKSSPFIYMSTNKVYGDSPNNLAIIEKEKRWEFDDFHFMKGINEQQSIDQSKHSFFGAGKLAADIYVQEFGRYFNMKTCCLRGGCLTGPSHSGVKLHGYLSYLVKCGIMKEKYTILGYKGKQVRDNIHSLDISKFIDVFLSDPKEGKVYNIGGGYENSCSILETIDYLSSTFKIKFNYSYLENNRIGDHICYYSDLTSIRNDYPNWKITVSLEEILDQLNFNWRKKTDS